MEPVVEISKKACPAVITIVVSKDLPKVEGYSFLPVGGKKFAVPNLDGKAKKQKTKIGGGSAFIVSPDGLIITSQHVVNDLTADYSVIIEPTVKYPAKVLARDPINDIAILKIEDKKKEFPYLELGNSDNLDLGQSVVAVGNALGEFSDTVSTGVISGLSRFIKAFGGVQGGTESLRGLIQTDAAINPGNSGGPLIDLQGKVIGINTAVVMGAQNIGFAIPINYAKKDIREVMEHGSIKRPFLGIKYILLTKAISEKNNLPVSFGALVVRETLGNPPVIKGSSADKAGVKEFDIILSVNDEKVDEKNPLSHILDNYKIGDTVNLKVLRGKKKILLKVLLGEKK
jgi:serine protease Do